MKKRVMIAIALLGAGSLQAQQKSEAGAVLNVMVPQCAGSKLVSSRWSGTVPSGWSIDKYTLESDDPWCQFDAALVRIADGRYFVGTPWKISGQEGATPAERIKNFAWNNFQLTFVVEPGATESGMQRVRLGQVTEAGRIPLEGWIDTTGSNFLMGDLAKSGADAIAKRDARLAPVIATSPALGPKDAPVTIIEFSDFQCPSCKAAHGFMSQLLEKHTGKIRYIRLDMPIVSAHPWAFPASVMGRAIWRQKPEAFFEYKKAVYENQADLNAFTIDEFGRHFAEDHGLDLKTFDADVASDALRKEILDSLGAAFTIHVLATPSYIVNGQMVAAGEEGKKLTALVDGLLAAKE